MSAVDRTQLPRVSTCLAAARAALPAARAPSPVAAPAARASPPVARLAPADLAALGERVLAADKGGLLAPPKGGADHGAPFR